MFLTPSLKFCRIAQQVSVLFSKSDGQEKLLRSIQNYTAELPKSVCGKSDFQLCRIKPSPKPKDCFTANLKKFMKSPFQLSEKMLK